MLHPRSFNLALSLLLLSAATLGAHCQVPCGIYDDAARVQAIQENITTIEKATRNIEELAGKKDAQSINQMTRWVHVKEQHASDIITIVSEYFLTQKLKPADGRQRQAYLDKLADHHAVMRAAMVTKQKVSLDAVNDLKKAVHDMARHWVDDGHGHGHDHGKAQTRRY